MGKRIGRYNIEIDNEIKKYNVYVNDYGHYFIYYNKEYKIIKWIREYRSGYLWKMIEEE